MVKHIKHAVQFLMPRKNAVGVFCYHSASVTVIIRSTAAPAAATLLKDLAQYLAHRMLAICTFVHFSFLLSSKLCPKTELQVQ